nr:hypothetical protein [Pajaroellobacter abortibovis]
MLAVLVMANSSVQHQFIDSLLTEEELSRVHNLLGEVIEGRTLNY